MVKFSTSLLELPWYGLNGNVLMESQSAQVAKRILKEWLLFDAEVGGSITHCDSIQY